MKYLIIFSALAFTFFTSQAQIKLATVDDLKQIMEYQDDTVVVLNFWATWCRPCVKELPTFDATGQELKSEGVEMILISLDALTRLETNVKPFLQKRNMKSTMWLLDDPDFNSWLPRLDRSYSCYLSD